MNESRTQRVGWGLNVRDNNINFKHRKEKAQDKRMSCICLTSFLYKKQLQIIITELS